MHISQQTDDLPHILVVDDDRRLRDLLTRFLRDHGYRVSSARDTEEARKKTECFDFDALILDVMMPGQSGFDYAEEIRETQNVPILMLTALSDFSDRIKGLELGADDYLTKPFDPRELMLRINNIIKRNPPPSYDEEPEEIKFGPFLFGFTRGELRKNGEFVRLTEREREILLILGRKKGEDVAREELTTGEGETNERTVDVQINRLRRKLEDDPTNPIYLQTVRGIGYRLVLDRS